MEPPHSTETPPPPVIANPEPVVEAGPEMDDQITPLPESATQSAAPESAVEVLSPLIEDHQSSSPLPPEAAASMAPPAEAVHEDAMVSDTVDAPVSPPAAQAAPVEEEEAQTAPPERTGEREERPVEEVPNVEPEEQLASAEPEPAVEVSAEVASVNVATKMDDEISQPPSPEEEHAAPQIKSSEPELALNQTTEPLLSNGLPQDAEELSEDKASSDNASPDEADAGQSQESPEEVVEDVVEEESNSEDSPPATANCPTEESTTMQGRVEFISAQVYGCHKVPLSLNVVVHFPKVATFVPKKRKNMKELNKKEAIGDLLDAFTEVGH